MLIRPKYHWFGLCLAAFYVACAIGVEARKGGTFMVSFYLIFACFLAIVWSSAYTTLSNGVLTRRVFFFPYKRIPVADIACIAPHRKNGKWSYGTVVDVYRHDGEKFTFQPNRPEAFLAALREQAPQAEYLF